MKRIVAFFAFLLASQFALAAPLVGGPAPGLWWNPSESGRGYTIELQDNLMVVTSYVYAQSGAATWYVSAGIYNFQTNTFNGSLDANTNGQCFGCAYVAPTGHPAAGGQLRIVFDTPTSGTLYFPGGSTRIVRQMYGYTQGLSLLRGQIVMSMNILGRVDGDWFVFNRYGSSASGPFVAGYFEGFPTSRVAVGSYTATAATGKYAMLVKIGSFYDFYVVDIDVDRVSGRAWIYRDGESPTGSGSPTFGMRMKTPTEVGASASSSPAQLAAAKAGEDARIATRAAITAEQDALGAGPAPAEVLALARELEAQLEQ